ncbi:hypothetical protein MUP65_00980 [Patescibacteria group bacterium]|nr:hypothetical protein [Patescibacteria group bacterium]
MVKTKQKIALVEIGVILVALALVVVLSLVNLEESRQTQRDLNRFSDLKAIAGALEVYYAKHHLYPPTNEGRIWACGQQGTEVCQWGEVWEDEKYIYTQTLPIDGLVVRKEDWPGYWYRSTKDGQGFIVSAFLETPSVKELVDSHQRCPGEWKQNEYLVCR